MYNRIFWLDDSPNFFDRMISTAQDAQLVFDLSAVARKTTFAFDFEMGREIVEREQFDLYILDADFPHRMADARRAALDEYLNKVRTGPINHWKEYNWKGDHQRNVNNNGLIFYEQLHQHIPSDKKVVVHSMSLNVPILAYLFDLPMYQKHSQPVDDIKQNITQHFINLRFDHIPGAWDRFVQKIGGDIQKAWSIAAPDLSIYECGGRKELIERYLL